MRERERVRERVREVGRNKNKFQCGSSQKNERPLSPIVSVTKLFFVSVADADSK